MTNQLHDAVPGVRAWIAAILFSLAALGFYTSRNTFPYYYHTDEPGKAWQVLTGEHNFHHPLLLLEATRAAARLGHVPSTMQQTIQAGRSVSGLFAAIAVGGFVLLAWQLGGARAGVLGGGVALFQPMLFELSHYMKEDCAMLAGIAACFAALAWYSRAPSLRAALAAGVAAGVAISGKYVGASALLAGFITIFATRTNRPAWKPAAIFIAAAAVIFACINLESFCNLHGAASGLGSEFVKIEEIADQGRRFFTRKYFTGIASFIPIPLLLGLIFWIGRRWKQRRLEPAFTWVLIGYPVLMLLLLSFSPKLKDRYTLPSFMLLTVQGALGILEIGKCGFKGARAASILLAVLAVAWPLPTVRQKFAEFASDDRRDLIAWMRGNLPADAVLVGDKHCRLGEAQRSGDPAYGFPQKIAIAKKYAAEFGTVEELRARGCQYVVVCDQEFNIAMGRKKTTPEFQERKTFYRTLTQNCPLLWQRPEGLLYYIHPGLRLYKL